MQNTFNFHDFSFGEKIGEGSFGEVYCAEHVTFGSVAVKVIDLETAEEELEDIQREILFLSRCNHPNCVKYYGSFLEKEYLHIVMEYLGAGSIHKLLKTVTLSESQIAVITREVLKGLEYLHKDAFLHRDIKAANILMSNDGQIKLADFGVSSSLSNATKRYTVVGTPYWMAPEVITSDGSDQKADIWSLGITCIELTRGSPPLSELNYMRAFAKITKSEPPKLEGNYSDSFKDFVAQCLVKLPQKRPTAAQLLHHEFITTAGDASLLKELVTPEGQVHRHKSPPRMASPEDKEHISREKELAESSGIDEWDLDLDTDFGSTGLTSLPEDPFSLHTHHDSSGVVDTTHYLISRWEKAHNRTILEFSRYLTHLESTV